eukprot:14926846-Alexandrium_andersonii.AAC.1
MARVIESFSHRNRAKGSEAETLPEDTSESRALLATAVAEAESLGMTVATSIKKAVFLRVAQDIAKDK